MNKTAEPPIVDAHAHVFTRAMPFTDTAWTRPDYDYAVEAYLADLDQHGVAIRTGHHCAQPVMDRFGVPATARLSLGLYNTRDDIDALLRGLHAVKKLFA